MIIGGGMGSVYEEQKTFKISNINEDFADENDGSEDNESSSESNSNNIMEVINQNIDKIRKLT